ncbi:MAG: acyltransferase [Salinivirgaceae bacterium]
MIDSFYTKSELKELGFKMIGDNVKISRFARFYSPNLISIGNNVRIDDFCLLSGDITLKNYIHISAFCALYGGGGIEMDDYSGLSPRCTLLSASDDFSGEFLIGPMVDVKYTNVTRGKITIKKYSQIGAGCVILPNITIEEGVAVGAMSLITSCLKEFSIYAGVPAKFMKPRKREMTNLLPK